MEIILLSKTRKSRRNISLGIMGSSALVVFVFSICAGLFYSGTRYASNQTAEILQTIREETTSAWQEELAEQGKILKQTKEGAEKSLDTMATRISILQGHVMKLDALGARLTTMADIDDLEFGIDHPPGMGGPAPVNLQAQQSINFVDFLDNLEQLEQKIQDRNEKLTAMETMLINRTLQEQIIPDGHPASTGWISSLFGYRVDPVTGKKEFHEGLDFAGKPGAPISSIATGIVTWSGPRYGYGNMVEVSHGGGYITRYAHNQKNLVAMGEKVGKGEVIAIMGNSGRSTGTHVHLEVMHNGKPVDPKKFIVLN